MKVLAADHPAIVNSRSIYQKNVYDPATYGFDVLKPSTNSKLGRKVTKGRFRGRPFYTLTLEERAGCDPACEHWFDCYGNSMPFAHRFRPGPALTEQVSRNLDECDRRHKRTGYLVRLHILGDFYSPEYVAFWAEQLANRPLLAVYGYTRHHPGKPIGEAVARLRELYGDRFAVRFSMLPSHRFSANNQAHAPEVSVTCPEQTGRAASCGECTLCWTTTKPITFIDH